LSKTIWYISKYTVSPNFGLPTRQFFFSKYFNIKGFQTILISSYASGTKFSTNIDFEKYYKIFETEGIAESEIIHLNVYIGPKTTFLANTVVYSNVSIIGNTTIHANCTIGPNTVIGNQGFGGEWYENNKIIMMPHVGGVIIEKNVRIGTSNTIVAGTINPTKVGAFTKFDDHVHFAHNCKTGEACFITACAQFSGRVTLGDRVWIGPNCSLMQGISIGNDAVIGLGSVVTKDVPIGTKVAGNPATDIVHFVKARKIINRLIDDEGN
jgi:UDP-3-O-[3-hydroxymyristoyl] glucosamine N-acyltransferase LpxD